MEHLLSYLVPITMSLAYLSLGIFINKENSRYLLAGYNTMSDEERSKFDIEGYLHFIKPFFISLEAFLLFTWILLDIFVEFGLAIVIWILIQIPPYIYFVYRSVRF